MEPSVDPSVVLRTLSEEIQTVTSMLDQVTLVLRILVVTTAVNLLICVKLLVGQFRLAKNQVALAGPAADGSERSKAS